MLSDTLHVVLHIPLVNKLLQFNFYRAPNIPLDHSILKKLFKYSIQEDTFQLDHISFPLSADIMACQESNGQFCCINSPLYVADNSTPCSYAPFLKDKVKINNVCILSVISQTQDETLNISDDFWAISTLQDNKKLYITCLQFSYAIKLYIPYDIIYLPNGCEANAIAFVLPSNNKLNIEFFIEAPEYKLGLTGLTYKLTTLA